MAVADREWGGKGGPPQAAIRRGQQQRDGSELGR